MVVTYFKLIFLILNYNGLLELLSRCHIEHHCNISSLLASLGPDWLCLSMSSVEDIIGVSSKLNNESGDFNLYFFYYVSSAHHAGLL